MEMTRTNLILTVAQAAREAHMTDDMVARIVNAVADPKVTTVARGDWEIYGESCPALLAGLKPNQSGMFPMNFDTLTREAAMEAVESEGLDFDNRERYIIRIV